MGNRTQLNLPNGVATDYTYDELNFLTKILQPKGPAPAIASYRLFLALLPLILQGQGEGQQAIVAEIKVVLYRYWKPLIDS